MITKPIGSRLRTYELPEKSYVDVEVVLDGGVPSLKFLKFSGATTPIMISPRDFLHIYRWATT